MTSVPIEIVRQKLNLILEYLVASGLDLVEFDANLYWSVPDEGKFHLDSDPVLEVGDLAFDVELISQIDEPLALELLYFSEVLRIIAFAGSKKNL